jgi:3'-phosphoadenosine 5'-phosphosulfate sulfotransferase (PAPS reductase)/FAD synthetase
VVLNLAILAANITGRLPVDVVMRDEEILYPGTFEYAERVAERPEVNFHWLVPRHPVINVFNRALPYFWTFDPLLPPSAWVREPPPYAIYPTEINIDSMTTPARFPVEAGYSLYAVIGLRVYESRNRLMGLVSSGGHLTKPNRFGVRNCRPVYDWTDADVWRAIRDHGVV